jgi:hypothetical protein
MALLVNQIQSILTQATNYYISAMNDLCNKDLYGMGACSVTWDSMFNLNMLINTLSSPNNYTVEQQECLLSKVVDFIPYITPYSPIPTPPIPSPSEDGDIYYYQ